MPYQDAIDSLSRTPIIWAVMQLDYCGRTFGVAPCLATGEPCYNTYPTCKYKSAYLKQSKDYEFSSSDAPLPFKTGERPYLKAVKWFPTEIKDNLTVKSRIKLVLHDEPDTDVDVDPYVSQRASVQGTFWKKLLARNRNYKGRTVSVFEGAAGLAQGDYEERFVGTIDSISLKAGEVTVEIVDLLASLDDIKVPTKLDIKLVTAINAAVTTMTLSTLEGLDTPAGFVRMGDEIVYYTGVNAPSNELTGCTRGYFGTTAAAHSANEKVQKVRYYAPANPFNILKEMLLTDAGFDVARVNSTTFDYWRDWPGGEVDFSAIISEPTKLSDLYFEIIDLLDCKSWVGEDLKVTIRRNIPNEPGRTYGTISDEANITNDPTATDLNDKSRIALAAMYWDKTALGQVDDLATYSRISAEYDPDAVTEYEDTPEMIFYCRWLRTGYMQDELLAQYIEDLLARRVWRHRDALPILGFKLELKDSRLKTGDYVRLSTDELLQKDGSPLVDAPFIVISRERQGDEFGFKVLQISPRKVDLIAPDAAPDWVNATDADKEYGYICDDDGLMPNGTPGYSIY